MRRLWAGALLLAAALLAWRMLDSAQQSPALDPALGSRLADLGYVDWVDLPDAEPPPRGVTLYDPARAHPGLNLYCSHARSGALLIDMRGNVVHRWLIPGSDARWEHVEMTPEGELLVIVRARDDPAILSLDWNSNVLWKRSLLAHHDIAVAPTGEIHTLTAQVIETPFGDRRIPLVDNAIASFTPGSEAIREISLFGLFGDQIAEPRLLRVDEQARRLKHRFRRLFGRISVKRNRMDLLHANSIQILDRRIEGFGAPGDALISIRELDLIAVVDETREQVVWSWGPGEIERPHHPTLLANGSLLVFDNGSQRKYSRVLELEPRSRKITWQYVADPPAAFFTHQKGAVDKLPNGNYLITESLDGRVFEITRAGDTVWEFYNPDVDEARRMRGEIYRMTRLEPAFVAAMRKAALPQAESRP